MSSRFGNSSAPRADAGGITPRKSDEIGGAISHQLREQPAHRLAEPACEGEREPPPPAHRQVEALPLRREARRVGGRAEHVLVAQRDGARSPLLLEAKRRRVPLA